MVLMIEYITLIIILTASGISLVFIPLKDANNSRCSLTVSSSYNISCYGHTPKMCLISKN
jgi:hypothetical protein